MLGDTTLGPTLEKIKIKKEIYIYIYIYIKKRFYPKTCKFGCIDGNEGWLECECVCVRACVWVFVCD